MGGTFCGRPSVSCGWVKKSEVHLQTFYHNLVENVVLKTFIIGVVGFVVVLKSSSSSENVMTFIISKLQSLTTKLV